MSQQTQYTSLAKILHWFVAGLIIAQYVLAELAEIADNSGEVVKQIGLLANHKSVGITVLTLALIRLVWRLFNKPPSLPSSMSVMQQRASHWAHWLIYGLIFVLPISGWLMSSANAYTVSWFNLIVLPDFVSPDKSLASLFHLIHERTSDVLFVIVLIHVVAALKHHYFDKDGVLSRMANPAAWPFLIIPCLLVLFFFYKQSIIKTDVLVVQEQTLEASPVINSKETLSDLPIWNIDYSKSYIQFTGDQAGAPFTGRWTSWVAELQFDSEQLDQMFFDVKIDTSQVDTADSDRDEYIVGSDFFDSKKHGEASFMASSAVVNDVKEFVSQGTLSIKGLSKAVEFTFSVERLGDNVVLNGSSTINRLAWNIGMGQWADPTWVGTDVDVTVVVVGKTQ